MNTIKSGNYDYLKLPLGALELVIVNDGAFDLAPIQPMFAPGIDPLLIEKFLSENAQDAGKLTLAGNVMVVKKDATLILIDTGSGTQSFPTVGKLTQNLALAGISKNDITDIVLTHAHPDHIGGILDNDGTLAFPNATVYLSKFEYDYWTAENPDFSKGTQNEIADYEIMYAKKYLEVIKPKLNFFDDNDELFGCLQLKIVPGHTPGHTAVTIFSQNEKLVHFADTFQHVMLLAHPEWGNQIDCDFELAIATRKKMGKQWAENKTFVFGNHLPFPGLGFIEKLGCGYQWMSKEF